MSLFCLVMLPGALLLGWFGRHRKFGFWGYFFASLALTPLVGALLVMAGEPRPRPGDRRTRQR